MADFFSLLHSGEVKELEGQRHCVFTPAAETQPLSTLECALNEFFLSVVFS